MRDRLEDEAAQASGAVRERLEAAARDLYRAHIETIHSFATALLRERPVEAELDPLFEVLEGLADSLDFDAPTSASRTSCSPSRCPSSSGRSGAGSACASCARHASA